MTAVWPPGLPQATEIDEYAETLPTLAIRTDMDAGPAKVRRRYSAGPVRWQGSLLLTQAETVTLEAFWRTTLGGGALAFAWQHPRLGTAATMRFTEPPAFRHVSGPLFRATLQIEILP
ncbi:MAG: hypothetical protein IOC87_04145 [Rhodobacter sp.]|jgi:hypothetical protein|nr:hypothetical protein [Rhodobacter sp.]